jgi:hypothetical protein
LMADLRALVDAGLVDELHEPGQPSRYGLSPFGAMLASAIASDSGTTATPPRSLLGPWPMGAAPCPACGATAGADGVAQCLHCSPSTSSSIH